MRLESGLNPTQNTTAFVKGIGRSLQYEKEKGHAELYSLSV